MNRLRAKELVSLLPGVHLRELQRLMNASFNTTRYHVYNLERDGEIVRAEEGGYSRLYPAGLEGRSRSLFSVLHSKGTRQVLRALLGGEQMGNADISGATEMPRSTVSEHLELLCRSGLIKRTVTLGGGAVYSVEDRSGVGEALAVFERNLLTVAADSFIDLWEF
jgi:predicted transcriptional regulator